MRGLREQPGFPRHPHDEQVAASTQAFEEHVYARTLSQGLVHLQLKLRLQCRTGKEMLTLSVDVRVAFGAGKARFVPLISLTTPVTRPLSRPVTYTVSYTPGLLGA